MNGVASGLVSLVICNTILLIAVALVGCYALYLKGDVKFVVSRKPLKIAIECREKSSDKRRAS